MNVVIDRLPAGQSLAFPPSHCPACSKPLAVKDLFPVLSYLQLRGRCRYCKARIPVRLALVEAGTGAAFGLLYAYLGMTPQLALALVYFGALLAIALIDLDRQLILNKLVYPMAVLAVVVSIAAKGFTLSNGWGQLVVPGARSAAIGFAIGLILFLLIAILSRGGMGMGDVKMAALMGLMLGFPSVLVGLFLAILAGGVVALILLALRKKGRKQAIPFGPFLVLGTMLALLWGPQLWQAYLSLFNWT